jgi:hypothetical protein
LVLSATAAAGSEIPAQAPIAAANLSLNSSGDA